MEILVNDLSIHEQFDDINSFRVALTKLMKLRKVTKDFGLELYCRRDILTAKPLPDKNLQQTVGKLTCESERRSVMTWLSRSGGPYWDDLRQHSGDDWLECDGEIVTDSAIGESAFRVLNGVDCGLTSFYPSKWAFTPVNVTWCQNEQERNNRNVALSNWWDARTLENSLRNISPPINTWNELRSVSVNRFQNLTFSEDCFTPLKGTPFSKSAAQRFIVLLGVIDSLVEDLDKTGTRTADGHRLYQTHFTGRENALFSDSSDSEVRDQRERLNFPHPDNPGQKLFCPWHGKVRHLTLRLHFSWPIKLGVPTYIVYAGPKLTKK